MAIQEYEKNEKVLVDSYDLIKIANMIRKLDASDESYKPSEMITTLQSIYNNLISVYDRTATEINLPNGLTSIGEYSFSCYLGLDKITLPKTVVSIERYAFDSCEDLKTIILPNSITTIDVGAFNYCSSLESINLPSELVTIKQLAFNRCSNLKNIIIPESVETIDTQAFGYCSTLAEVTFEGQPNSIGTTAFTKCDNLLVINVPWSEGEVANAPWGATNATIHYNHIGTVIVDATFKIGAGASSTDGEAWENNARMIAVQSTGEKAYTYSDYLFGQPMYPISIPDKATKIKVTCPNFYFGLIFANYENDKYVTANDAGWRTYNSGEYSFEAGAYSHVHINFKNSSNNQIPTDTDTSEFSIVFE